MEGINTPFVIDEHTAIVMTDPQNDFLSENGLGWGAFGENIQKNGTVENLRRIFEVAAAKGMLVFISPHYYYKHDHQWLFEGPIVWRANLCATFLGNLVYPTPASKMLHFP